MIEQAKGTAAATEWVVKKTKTVVSWFAGLLVLLLILFLAEFSNNVQILKGAYLRHLKSKEVSLDTQVRSLPRCPEVTLQMPEEQRNSAIACEVQNYNSAMNLLGQAIETHKKRLRLDVKWGFADGSTGDGEELGWNHPRPEWDGNKWACPVGTEPHPVKAEQEAGANAYIHCFKESEFQTAK